VVSDAIYSETTVNVLHMGRSQCCWAPTFGPFCGPRRSHTQSKKRSHDASAIAAIRARSGMTSNYHFLSEREGG